MIACRMNVLSAFPAKSGPLHELLRLLLDGRYLEALQSSAAQKVLAAGSQGSSTLGQQSSASAYFEALGTSLHSQAVC
jgi:hypothetical protein